MKKRIHFFAKPKIQLKYVFITLVLVLVTALLSIYVMDYRIIHSTFAENLCDAEVAALSKEVRTGILWVLGIVLVMAFVQATIFFHQLVGPLVALERTMDVMREGYFGGRLELRKRDELKDLAEKIEDLGIKISQEVKISKQAITEITERINGLKDKMSESDYKDIKEKLKGLFPFFKEHLGPPAK
ncbi:MAG: hypothetical protein ABIH68_06845 [bacterium]